VRPPIIPKRAIPIFVNEIDVAGEAPEAVPLFPVEDPVVDPGVDPGVVVEPVEPALVVVDPVVVVFEDVLAAVASAAAMNFSKVFPVRGALIAKPIP